MAKDGRTFRFVVIGVGGVGTWLSRALAMMLESKFPDSGLILVDGDTFEKKNKERQIFNGVGNKAEVLATQYSSEFRKIAVLAIPAWVVATAPEVQEPENELDGTPAATKIAASNLLNEGDVVFATVDNFKARKDIFEAASQFKNIDIFTGGNDDGLFGSIYHYCRRDGVDVTMSPLVMHDEYANPTDRNPGEMSCQERAAIDGGTQFLASNVAVAAFLLGRVQKVIIEQEPDLESEIYFHLGEGQAASYDRSAEQSNILTGAVN